MEPTLSPEHFAENQAACEARDTWLDTGRLKQFPPLDGDWLQLIWKAGRGFGKTLSEVQWGWWEAWRLGQFPFILHAVAPTLNDCRGTLFLGPAGFRACIPAECLRGGSWEQATDIGHLEIKLTNGALIKGFGAQDGGGRLRGPQCHAAIGDELREWDKPKGNLESVHANMEFGVRLPYPDKSPSRIVMGTTPRAIPFLKKLYREPGVKVVTGTTYENLENLAESFRRRILRHEGTEMGRVEIHAEDVDEEANAIFKRSWIRLWPAGKRLPVFSFVALSLDTSYGEETYDDDKGESDPSACAVIGVFNTHEAFTKDERDRMRIKTRWAALLCDFWTERLGFPELCEKVRVTYRTRWGSPVGPGLPARKPDVVLIEAKASGISLRQVMVQYGVPTWPFNPGRQNKTMRAHATAPFVLQGMFFVPESTKPDSKGKPRDWVEALLDQLCTFAGEGSIPHDDGVDTFTQIMLYLAQSGMFHVEPQERASPDPEEKKEAEEREAIQAANREKRSKTSAYGA